MRETGYYWVIPHDCSEWTVLKFVSHGKNITISGEPGIWLDEEYRGFRHFKQINETRILNPDESNSLLQRYMHHVSCMEGIDFSDSVTRSAVSEYEFSNEEVELIKKLSELNKQK